MKFLLHIYFAVIVVLALSCNSGLQQKADFDFYQSELFKDVQLSGIFPDSKTFVDCTPRQSLSDISDIYRKKKDDENFVVRDFALKYFELPEAVSTGYQSDTTESMSEHVISLWPVLTRQPDKHNLLSSLIPLPNAYIVPGGRFREIYYWDSYFTMEGLMLSGQEKMATNMVNNFSFLIDSLGFIPNGNRNYYRGRSQPPFYALMVDLIASDNRDRFISYLPYLEKEYAFWMQGSEQLSGENRAYKRVVYINDSTILNRYWDNYDHPRPESFKPDYELVHANGLDPSTTYRHLRAGAESGWDYSSRWFKNQKDLSTIHTTDIIPVDLNALLYFLEVKISQAYNWDEKLEKAEFYLKKAESRKQAINTILWNDSSNFYTDFDFIVNRQTAVLSLAAAYPLYFKLATKAQAREVAARLTKDFLKSGGFVTTLNNTGQQWDAPNGWAPLQWITINALYNYGYGDQGNEAATRWLKRNQDVYKATGKMMEKYNVVDTLLLAGGGEYPLQDGFGWTNGVAIALQKILTDKVTVEEMTVH